MGLILGTIGAIVTTAVTISKSLAIIGLAVQGLKVIGNAIASIAKALGVIKTERGIEELGDRALQAEEKGITPDKYATYEAWVKEVEKDDWGYDPEKNKNIDIQKKIFKGIEVASAILIEHFPELPMKEFLSISANNPEFFTVDRMSELAKLANNDYKSFEYVINYVTGEAKDHKTIDNAVDILMDIERMIDTNISENSAYDKVVRYKDMKQI